VAARGTEPSPGLEPDDYTRAADGAAPRVRRRARVGRLRRGSEAAGSHRAGDAVTRTVNRLPVDRDSMPGFEASDAPPTSEETTTEPDRRAFAARTDRIAPLTA